MLGQSPANFRRCLVLVLLLLCAAVAAVLWAQQPTLLEPEQLRFSAGSLPTAPSEVSLWARIGNNLLVRLQLGTDFEFQMTGGVPVLRVKFPPAPTGPSGVYNLRGVRQSDASYVFPQAPPAGLTVLVYRSGAFQAEGDDYTRDTANTARIVPLTPWTPASKVIAHYLP